MKRDEKENMRNKNKNTHEKKAYKLKQQLKKYAKTFVNMNMIYT